MEADLSFPQIGSVHVELGNEAMTVVRVAKDVEGSHPGELAQHRIPATLGRELKPEPETQ